MELVDLNLVKYAIEKYRPGESWIVDCLPSVKVTGALESVLLTMFEGEHEE